MLCGLIMAGGKGTRFWPLSTEEKPKQFLTLLSDKSMLQMTVDRIKNLIPLERIFVCTGENYVGLVKEQLPELPDRNIIIEPEGRNTAPCIALSAMIINRYYKNSTMIVLPSDHLVRDEGAFLNCVSLGYEFVQDYTNAIVTLGIRPTRPETGYGYIKIQDDNKIENKNIYKANRFVEKPNIEKALEYLKQGSYFWNGGMFIWKINTILNLTEKHLMSTFSALKEILNCPENEIQSIVDANYRLTENTSVDFGIMEKAEDIYVITSDFGWDDVGNWTSIERYSSKDENGNVFNADGVSFKSNNNIVLTNKKILLNNVNDLIVVETDDYIMISSKHSEQEIKKAKELL
ncbi:mannose-1-phosphate guanylyltransferase [Clostridium sp. 'White wine YQ']|uniref:mannose-1-phosphate guanylyltransferase n=1 Tax=Clostridium sp. 'White wine YQ' TaxID=3027474 RepID=UPI00236636B7|nr:mannose-1-phosphate guanylyltransferase [Clostridium sp. 'White wine YQ']MDD7792746.1 mannose-1-phosphate guanylyltransferase [Clostridium sp. 'White wine YQ']